MKKYSVIAFLLAFTWGLLPLSAQEGEPELKSFVLNDTTFLYREHSTACGWHRIYIEHNRKNDNYEALEEYSISGYRKDGYDRQIEDIKEGYPNRLKKFALGDLPRDWLPLRLFEGKYYIYAPSEWTYADHRVITDVAFVEQMMDGPWPSALKSFKKTGDRYDIEYYTYADGVRSLAIHMIDTVNKIAVWEYKNNEGEPVGYELRVASSNVRLFPLVVNDWGCRALFEVVFDRPDCKAILAGTQKPVFICKNKE